MKKGAANAPRPRRTSIMGNFASTTTKVLKVPPEDRGKHSFATASQRQRGPSLANVHDPAERARIEEEQKYKTIIVCGGATTAGNGFCSPADVHRLLCAPPPFKPRKASDVRRGLVVCWLPGWGKC